MNYQQKLKRKLEHNLKRKKEKQMAFVFNKDQMSGITPVVPGLYLVKFDQFKPKLSKAPNKEGKFTINLNAWCYITQHPTIEEHKQLVVANLNESIPSFLQDFCHSFGVPMDDVELPDGSIGAAFPGSFEAGPNYKADDLSTWVYAGPLVGQVAQWELGVKIYNGRETQEIRKFVCAIPDCASKYPDIRHSTDMAKKG